MHIGEGNIVIPNRGDQPAFPKFLVSSPGRAWIEDGPGGQMVELPLLTPHDGTVLVDTDPTARTITATTDPVDPLFYRIARNSELLEFFLHDLTATGLPVWRRFNGRFTTPWPAKTVCRIKVRHSNPGGSDHRDHAAEVRDGVRLDACHRLPRLQHRLQQNPDRHTRSDRRRRRRPRPHRPHVHLPLSGEAAHQPHRISASNARWSGCGTRTWTTSGRSRRNVRSWSRK